MMILNILQNDEQIWLNTVIGKITKKNGLGQCSNFRQPKEPAFEDSTAAAIAVCGIIEVAKTANDINGDCYFMEAVFKLKGENLYLW